MLKLINIKKDYGVGEEVVHALKGIDLSFRRSEFVAILGHSGCGKTTLLNIIGGLDRYTDGELIIDGVPTKMYKDRDWDTYRNHSIGFVFQTYNLITHQSVLSNVELALTVSGVSRAERKKRAMEALSEVGLADKAKKRPNQLSGGQMQRVAIARALINNPEILLADEPTGALDTDTSEQVMEILKKVSEKRLVIMVTHNPELAEKYATRIIKVKDGLVKSDSAPYEGEQREAAALGAPKKSKVKGKKASMSFLTAFSLSLNNLMTKKARTILTSVAGSIGIIGIALILSISSGVNAYINKIQKETLASYPITLQAELVDITSMMNTMAPASSGEPEHELDAVYQNKVMADIMNTLTSIETTKNNLSDFKKYLEENNIKDEKYISSIQYSYALKMNAYTKDPGGKVVKADADALFSDLGTSAQGPAGFSGVMSMYSESGITIWQEMLPGNDGALIGDVITEQYTLVGEEAGSRWAENAGEIMLVISPKNELSDVALYALGLVSYDEMMAEVFKKPSDGKTDAPAAQRSWKYEDIIGREFKYIYPADMYTAKGEGYVKAGDEMLDILYSGGLDLKIVGIIKPAEDSTANILTGNLAYTSALTKLIADASGEKDIIKKQLENKDIDIFTGLPFEDKNAKPLTNSEKAVIFKEYAQTLSSTEKAALCAAVMSALTEEEMAANADFVASQSREALMQMFTEGFAGVQTGLDPETVMNYITSLPDSKFYEVMTELYNMQYGEGKKAQLLQSFSALPAEQIDAMLLSALDSSDEKSLADLHDSMIPSSYSKATYDENIKELGYLDYDSPSAINLYAVSFEDKDKIAKMIEDYNQTAAEANKIEYVDYVALLMSSVTDIINAISYVLIAFVSISLVVSSIMIGVITYISVLERTKEIGILRAIGASKGNISSVFNAETLIVGLISGLIGIGGTVLLCIPINLIIHSLTGIEALRAALPLEGAFWLVVVSVVLTMVAGLIPSRMAAGRDPVTSLRSE